MENLSVWMVKEIHIIREGGDSKIKIAGIPFRNKNPGQVPGADSYLVYNATEPP